MWHVLTFTFGTSSLTSNITVRAAVSAVTVTKDTTATYKAGDNITLKLVAKKADASINTAYNETEYITFATTNGESSDAINTYNRAVKFVNGEASVAIPVTKITEKNVQIGATGSGTIAGVAPTKTINNFTVSANAFSTYKLTVATNSITAEPVDAYGNNVSTKTVSSELVKVSAITSAANNAPVAVTGLDAEGYAHASVNPTTQVLTINAGGFANAQIVTVIIDGISYTVTAVIGA